MAHPSINTATFIEKTSSENPNDIVATLARKMKALRIPSLVHTITFMSAELCLCEGGGRFTARERNRKYCARYQLT